MNALELIEEARNEHHSFSRDRHPDKALFMRIVREEPLFFRAVSDVAENALSVERVFTPDDIALALAGAPLGGIEGESLVVPPPAFIRLLPSFVVIDNTLQPVAFMQDERSGESLAFRIRVQGQRLYITQPADVLAQVDETELTTAWEEVQALRVQYVPLPTPLLGLEHDMTAPDTARSYFIGTLVDFMARRGPWAGADRAELIARGAEMRQQVLEGYMGEGQHTGWYVSRI